MKLSVMERFTVLSLMPETGTFFNLKLVREAREALSFTEKENKLYNFQVLPNGSTTWTLPEKGEKEAEIKLADPIVVIIKDALKELDKDAKLEDKHFTLYEKFIGV